MATTTIWLATLPHDGPSGGLFRDQQADPMVGVSKGAAGGPGRGFRALPRGASGSLMRGLRPSHDHTGFRASSWRAIIMRWISLVPSPMNSSGASR